MKKYGKLILFLVLVAAIAVLNRRFGWSDYLRDTGNLTFLQTLVGEHLWQAAALYTLITVVACVVLALPGVTFAVFAGILFGPWLGTVLCLTATTLGAMAAFLVGRFFLKESVQPMVERNKTLKRILFDEAG